PLLQKADSNGLAKRLIEEPDALIGQVRICGSLGSASSLGHPAVIPPFFLNILPDYSVSAHAIPKLANIHFKYANLHH
ncbi:MAG: hypothetical protein M3Q07_01280, partial [Pseudobdellovibrionaceae bacterium]|nr:hypothetical protein [Pseudobdellovibrionaceae bacterium]